MATTGENLRRLDMTGDPLVATDDIDEWCRDKAVAAANSLPFLNLDISTVACSLALGFQYGLAYAREFGIPDCAKALITLKD